MSLPDFMCIGAQKAGTTWLDFNLRYHPQLWFPPAKEIHYFNRVRSPYVRLLFADDPHYRYLIYYRSKIAIRDILKRIKRPQACAYAAAWYGRFFFQRRTPHWYANLFAPAAGQVAGEVTPGYAVMVREQVRELQQLMPGIKIIYLLRNPIERVWSQLRMRYTLYGHRGVENVAAATLLEFVRDSNCIRHSFYLKTLDLWECIFSPQQIFVGFFDDIRKRPHALLQAIYRFLGVSDSPQFLSPRAGEKIFAGVPAVALPATVVREVVDRLYPETVALHNRFDNPYTERWLVQAETLRRQREGDGC